MSGGYVFVAGPSGAGKDTLLRLAQQELADDPLVLFPQRVVTRTADDFEDSICLSLEEFEAREAAGEWALAWRAHGNAYALPVSTLEAARAGALVICNVSRASIASARRRLPVLASIEITASPERLAARIAARGRDGDLGEGLKSRLARSELIEPFVADVRIVNDGCPQDAAQTLIETLRQLAGNLRGS